MLTGHRLYREKHAIERSLQVSYSNNRYVIILSQWIFSRNTVVLYWSIPPTPNLNTISTTLYKQGLSYILLVEIEIIHHYPWLIQFNHYPPTLVDIFHQCFTVIFVWNSTPPSCDPTHCYITSSACIHTPPTSDPAPPTCIRLQCLSMINTYSSLLALHSSESPGSLES